MYHSYQVVLYVALSNYLTVDFASNGIQSLEIGKDTASGYCNDTWSASCIARKGILRIHQQSWKAFQQNYVGRFVVKATIVAALGVLFMAITLGVNMEGTHAQSFHNASGRGSANLFPYGQCTWWADQRYHQLHGRYVPWRTNANAWQWTARAHNFGWHVSRRPRLGDIIDLQPWVQGAYGLGHVAVVERVLRNGHVIASNMNWGAHPRRVTYVEFAPGAGVTFIHQ